MSGKVTAYCQLLYKEGTNLTRHDVNWSIIAKIEKKQGTILSVEYLLLGLFLVFLSQIRVWTKISSSSRVNDTMVYIALPKIGNQVGHLTP